MPLPQPDTSLIHEMYTGYIGLVKDEDFTKTLHDSEETTLSYLQKLTKKQWEHRYADGKWSIKEILLHIIDTERIFSYRALRFARNDETELQGFDQDFFVTESEASQRTAHSLLEEYRSVRASTLDLFRYMPSEAYDRIGSASERPFSVLAIGFIIAGHELHHMSIIRERYFPELN